jgi:hypothetical protein
VEKPAERVGSWVFFIIIIYNSRRHVVAAVMLVVQFLRLFF